MHFEGKLILWSHNTSYCLREVVTKAGLTVYIACIFFMINLMKHWWKKLMRLTQIFH